MRISEVLDRKTALTVLQFSDEYADTQIEVDGALGCLNAFRLLKGQFPLLKVILSVGGGTGSAIFPEVAADHSSRLTFARKARELVDTYGFHGIDSEICWIIGNWY